MRVYVVTLAINCDSCRRRDTISGTDEAHAALRAAARGWRKVERESLGVPVLRDECPACYAKATEPT